MIQAISPLTQFADPEYLRIKQELMSLGVAPTGSKEIDKAKLHEAKEELVQKIQEKDVKTRTQELQVQPMNPVDETADAKRSEMEQQRLGAVQVSELLKLYHGLL